jgi:hypothetical protein
VAYPEALVELLLGGVWVDVTNDVYVRGRITITRGRKDRAAKPSPSRCRFYLKNSPAVRARYSPVNPTGEYYGLLLPNTVCRVSVNPNGTRWYRFCGVIPEFVLDRNATDLDRWVAVDAFGPLYALQGGNPPAYDALRRHIANNGPLACWPLTDGAEARQGTEIISGGQPIRAVGIDGSFFQGQPNWSRGSVAPWLEPVVSLPSGTEGNLSASVQPVAVSRWAADHVRSGVGGVEDDFSVFDTGDGTIADPLYVWIVAADATADTVRLDLLEVTDVSSSVTTLWTQDAPGIFDESPHMIRLVTAANGASDTDWSLVIDGTEVQFGSWPVPHRPAARFRYRWGAFGSMDTAASLGYITYWGNTFPDADQTWAAVQGHDRDRAGRRIERLCAEEGIPLRVVGDLDATPLMGPQRADDLMRLLEAAIAVDGGTLTDATDELALELRTNRSKYSQGVGA